MDSLISFISGVGFPIAACVGVGYMCKYMFDKFSQMIANIESKHEDEISRLETVIQNNTEALIRLQEKEGT